MSFLSIGGKKSGATKPDYTGLQIQTSVNTLPIPVVWGTSKLAPNIIWAADFASHAQKQNAGGKGGGGGAVAGYDYSTSVIMGLCEGAISGINQIWVDQNNAQSVSALGLTLYTGAGGQAPWSYVVSAHAAQAMSYPGTAYLCAANYDLGSSASMPNHNMEVVGLLAGTGGAHDADPAQVVSDFLTNPQYGVPGFPASSIDAGSLLSGPTAATSGDAAYQTYCRALGLVLSPCLSSVETASSVLDRWLKLTNTAAVWSGSVLKFIPYGDEAISANGVVFQPDVTPIYDLDDDDFVTSDGEDPVQISRSDPADAKNVVRIEVLDRANEYKVTPIEARDQNAIELYGLRIESGIAAHEICDAVAVAPLVAQLLLQRGLYIRNTYSFTLSWEYCLLEPMDLVTLTDPGLGLNKVAVRITAIAEDRDGQLAVTAEEFPPGHASATLYAKQTGGGAGLDMGVAPGPVNPPVLLEPSPELTTNNQPELWIGASGGASWGGCDLWVSADNLSYAHIGTIKGGARQGLLSAAIGSDTDPDTTGVLGVDLSLSRAQLSSGTQSDADNARTLLYADGELMAFETATLTSAYHYNLGYLRRGLYGTARIAHASGGQFCRLDNAVFRYSLPANIIGQNLYVKLQSFNLYGDAPEDLSTVTAYEYLVTGKGAYIAPPSGMTITSNARTQSDGTNLLTLVFAWVPSAGPLLDSYEVQWKTASDADWSSRIVGYNVTSARLDAALSNTTYSARVRAISRTGYRSGWADAADTGSGALWSVVPAAPSGLTAVGGLQSITLNWAVNPETNIDCYRVFSAEGNDGDFGDAALVASVFATTWTHSNLGFGETRRYWLEAVNVAGPSSPTGPVAATTSYNIDAANIVDITEDRLATALAVKIDTSAAAATSVDNIQQTISTLISMVDTAIGTATAAVQDEAQTRANADGSVMAERTIKVQALSDGRQAIAGIGLIADASGASVQSEVLILAEQFIVASVNDDGSVVALAPFTISGGDAYFTGKVYMNDLVTAAETTALLEIHPPADGSGGLKVYANDGTGEKLVFDPTHGLGIGQATPVYTASLSGTVSIGTTATVVSLPAQSYYGRAALAFVDIATAEVHYDGGLQNVTLYVQVDGTTVSSIVVSSGQAASESFLLLPGKLSAAPHVISLALSSEAGGSAPTTITSCTLSVLDFKA